MTIGKSVIMKKPYIIGITGGSGSGKTVFLKKLLESFTDNQVCVVSQDNYYKAKHLQPVDDEGIPNFDTPLSLDSDLFLKDLDDLKKGLVVERPEYAFNNPAGKPRLLVFKPAPVIIVEGIFVFYFPEIARQLDLKIFIDARESVKLSRRIRRDREERGYEISDVLYRYEKHVAPTYEKYIEPFKHEADLVVPNNAGFQKALDVLTAYLKLQIEAN